jgi:hypothetical protein
MALLAESRARIDRAIGEFHPPGGGTPVTTMWRDPSKTPV